jgi:hypothetical protein
MPFRRKPAPPAPPPEPEGRPKKRGRRKDTSVPLPPVLRPAAQKPGDRRRGPRRGPGEPEICWVCRGTADSKPPVPARHMHDFNWAGCKCRHPNHGLPKNKR